MKGSRKNPATQGRVRELLRDREYLAYFVARQSARFGYSIESVAIGWQIYTLRHNAFDLGLAGLMLFLPQLVLAIPAGMMADRFDRRMVCMLCACGEVVAELGFVALILTGSRSLALNFCAIAVIGIAHSLGDPAERALLASVVKAHRFVRAQALSTSVSEVITIGGPAVGGLLLAASVPLAFAVAAVSYACGAIAFSFLTPREQPDGDLEPQAAMDGIRFIFKHPVVLGAISLDLFAVLFGGATALLPIFATAVLHIGPIGFGALRSAPAVGATAVAAYIARHPLTRHAGPLMLWCVAGFGIATIVFGISHNLVVSLIALALTGGFDIVSVVIRATLVQLGTSNAMRGRVSAIENIFIGASNQLGAFESGTLAGFIGPVESVVVGGCATLVVIAIWAWRFPALRTYDRFGDGDA
ncbi:MAG TPA: MFS transporter [Candidatus Baltobacteraceae bacterium]